MSQYLRMMSLKMRWVWIWATFGIQTETTIPDGNFTQEILYHCSCCPQSAMQEGKLYIISWLVITNIKIWEKMNDMACYKFKTKDTWLEKV